MAKRFTKISVDGNLIFMDPAAKQQIRKAMDKENVELDMSGVEFMDSMGVDLIYRLCRHVRAKNGSVRIKNVRPNVKEVMDLCSIGTIAEISLKEEE